MTPEQRRKGKGKRKRKDDGAEGFVSTMRDAGIMTPEAFNRSQKRRPKRHKNNGGKERPLPRTRQACSAKPVQETEETMDINQVTQQAAPTEPGPNGPVPHVPVAGGVDAAVFGQQVMGSISASLESWSTKAASVITKKSSEIFDDLRKREAELKALNEPTWQEHVWDSSRFVGKVAVVSVAALAVTKAGAHLIKGVLVGKAAKAAPAVPAMPVTPTY